MKKSQKYSSLPKKIGRPSEYNTAIAEKLCLAIATSSKGLRRICSENPKFPNPSTVYNWIMAVPAFREQYACAKEFQTQALFDELIELADCTRMGVVTKVDHKGRKAKRIADMTDRARLQIDTRKWALSKLLPKKYGDHLELGVEREDPLRELVASMRAESLKLGPPEGMEDDELVQ
jgi:hypothetical protein